LPLFGDRLEFKDEDTVYNASIDMEFIYVLSDGNNVTEITF